MQIAPDLYLTDVDDVIEIIADRPMGSDDIILSLLPGKILVDNRREVKTISINAASVIQITVDQGGNRGPNTSAEIYIKNNDELFLVASFRLLEPVTDLRKTKLYQLAELLAKRIAGRYSINWEYKYSIDPPEKEKRQIWAVVAIVLGWIIMAAIFIIRFKK